MDVRCERCRAQFVVEDERVTLAGLTVSCTVCGHVFRVKKKELVVTVPVRPDEVTATPLPITEAAPRVTQAAAAGPAPRPSTSAVPAAPDAPAREWRIRRAGGDLVTFRELSTLQKWIVERKVGADDELTASGQGWRRLGDIAALRCFFDVVEAARAAGTPGAAPAAPAPGAPPPSVEGLSPAPPPPPPSGLPPPWFAVPPAGAAFPPPPITVSPARAGAEAPSPPGAAAEAPSPPGHDVDVRFDDEAPVRRRSGSSRTFAAVAAVVVAAAVGAALLLPRLRPEPEPPPPPVAVAPEPPPAVEAPPPPPPEPAPPAAPVEAPGAAPSAGPVTTSEPAAEEGPPPPAPAVKPPAPPRGGPKALLARAKALQEKGEAAAALELFGRVASDDPRNVDAQAGRGLCYLDLEKWAPAEASFQAALQLEPDHADALLGLAETYRFQGKKAEAIPAYERYLAAYPDGEEAQVARNALAALRE